MKKIVYLVKKGNEYLTALVGPEGETDVNMLTPCFSIYRYDAAQLERAKMAAQIIAALQRDENEKWSVERYNKMTYMVEAVATCG